MIKEISKVFIVGLLGLSAITINDTIYYRGEVENVPYFVRRHEYVHIKQYEENGIINFLSRYIAEYTIYRAFGYTHQQAYEAISFEKEAREGEFINGRNQD